MGKRIISVVLLLIIISGLSGCMMFSKRYTVEEKKEMVLAYLKAKYGEEFVGKSFCLADLMQSHDEFTIYPKNGSKDDWFRVWGYYDKDEVYKMSDGYFGFIIHDEYEKVMRGIVSEFYNEYKLTVDTKTDTVYSDRYNRGTKISELYKKGENKGLSPWVNIYVKNSSDVKRNVIKVLQNIAGKMKERKLEGLVDIQIVREDKYNYFCYETSFFAGG